MSGFENPIKIREFDGGVNTKQRRNKIKKSEQSSLIGMDFSANSARRIKGYERLGEDDDEDKIGKTLYKHKILNAQEVLIKVIGGILKYYDEIDGKWYRITDKTFTKHKRWTFETFNGFLFGNNGVDDWIRWDGSARSTNQNSLDGTSTEIELEDGHGDRFPSSGTVFIQGIAIDYGSKSGDKLQSISGLNESIDAGKTVILESDNSDNFTSPAKAKQIAYHNARMYLIDAENPNIVRHSKLADNTDPEDDLVNFSVSGSGTGDAGFGILPDAAVSLREYIEGSQSSILAVLAENGVAYSFSVTDGSSTTTNAFIPLRTMNTYPQSKQMVTIAENDIVMTDNIGHVRSLGYGDINTPLRVRSISEVIEPSLESVDFSEGDMIYYNRKLYVVGKSEKANENDVIFFRDSQYEAWGLIKHWDVISFAEYEDELYGLSTRSGKVWKLNSTYSANGNTYSSELTTKEFDFGEPHKYKEMIKFRFSGLITEAAEVEIDVFFDNQNDPTTFKVQGGDGDIIMSSDPNVAIGTVVFGESVYGGGVPGGTSRREFAAEATLNTNDPFLKMSYRLRIDGENIDFELNDLTMFVKLHKRNFWKDQQAVSISD